ncbi:hypothetical protein D3C81_1567900 [compost metagenome]
MPDIVRGRVRAADPFGISSFIVVRIASAKDHPAGVQINRIVLAAVIEIRQRQKTRHIGVIHQIDPTEPIHLVRIHLSKLLVIDDRVLFNPLPNVIAQRAYLIGEIVVPVKPFIDLQQITQHDDRKQVRWNEIAVFAGIIAWAETRPGHARIRYRSREPIRFPAVFPDERIF